MKYFVVSDIHSFYTPLKKALDQAGFDLNNPNHKLIVCGDIFDRGEESKKVFDFLYNLPDDKVVLIKGNHESLLLEAISRWESYHKRELSNTLFEEEKERGLLYRHDLNNGTLKTIADLTDTWEDDLYEFNGQYRALKELSKSPVVKWLRSKKWINYYEVDNYIFVHSFIPLHNRKNVSIYSANFYAGLLTYFKNWRKTATKKEWEDSRWGCPWKQYDAGLFEEETKKGKILVCGHWHTSSFFEVFKWDYDHEGDIYFSKNLIAIDGGVSYNYMSQEYLHEQNVLVIDEDGICYDKEGNKLVELPEPKMVNSEDFCNEEEK